MHCGGGSCGMPQKGCSGGGRRFFTKKEQIERLQEYLKMLEKEIDGVKEHIEMLKKHKV